MPTYKKASGEKITVPVGACYNGWPVNRWTDEQRAEVGLFPLPGPAPSEPTSDDLLEQVRAECGHHIEFTLGWSDRIQRSALAGLYGQTVLDAMKTTISACIAECNRCEDLIRAEQLCEPAWPTSITWEEAKQL